MGIGGRVAIALIVWIATAALSSSLRAQAPASAPVASPFDQNDPEIAKIKKLDWQNANFDALTPPTRCAALMALNRGLANLGAKADSRVELLVDYLDERNLGQVYAAAKSAIPEPPPITFEKMEKVAAAYVLTPEGAARYMDQFTGMSPDMLNRYTALYDKSARREFEETREARWQVRSMGLFLQETGKLDDFRAWSIDAAKRRQEEIAKAQAEQQAQEQQQREERAAAYAQQQQQQQLAAQQMSVALQSQQDQQYSSSGGQTSYVDNDGWWGYPYGWAGGYYAYYNSNAYRGYVRDKAQDAYQRWQNNGGGRRPSQLPAQRPMPARRGGGFRGR